MKRTAALVLLLALACATPQGTKPAAEPGTYKTDETPLAVGAIPNGMLRDEQRGKDVPVAIEYPTRGGPFPVIVFSHGFGGLTAAYAGISSYWAGHGFVVIRPQHADAGTLTKVSDLETIWSRIGERELRDRARDATFVLDSLSRLEELYPELKGKIDATKIGAGGHSLGALTAMQLSGVVTTFGGTRLQLRDPRVRAAVIMSPQPSGVGGLTRDSWNELRVPTLFMTGSLDRLPGEKTAERRREAFELSPAGDKIFLRLEGARHMSFTGRFADIAEELTAAREAQIERAVPTDPFNPNQPSREQVRQHVREAASEGERRIFNAIRIASVAFWEAYLEGEPKAKEFVDTRLEAVNGGRVMVERK